MKNNQDGFGAVEGLLILVIVGLLGSIGWYVWHTKSNADKNFKAATSSSVSTSTAKNSTSQRSSGIVVKSADNSVQITLPTGYNLSSRTDGGSTCGFAPTAPAPGTCISDIAYDGVPPKGGYVKVFKTTENVTDWYKTTFGDCSSPHSKTIGNNPELICAMTSGHVYTISNGQYVAYFVSDDSSQSLSVISSIKFL